jgi:streptogramin lyase
VIGRGSRFALLGLLVALAAAFCFPELAGAVTFDTFPVEEGSPAGSHIPLYITASPLGTLWFTDLGRAVREINTSGAPLATIDSSNTTALPTGDLAFAPDGTLYWAAEPGGNGGYGRRFPNGEVKSAGFSSDKEVITVGHDGTGAPIFGANTQAAVPRPYGYCGSSGCMPVALGEPTDLVSGPKTVWVVAQESDEVVRVTETGGGHFENLVIEMPAGTNPGRAALGPEGDLWVTALGAAKVQNQIIRVTPQGIQTSFALPAGTGPEDIALGPDGALWFAEFGANGIGRITTSGEFSSCALPNAAAGPHPFGITVGPEGAIWFTEKAADAIGRLSGGNCAPVPPGGGGGSGAGAGGGGGQAGGSSAAAKPSLSGLSLAPAGFAAASSGGSVPPKLKKGTGTKVSFRASVAGGVRFTVERKTKGRRAGGHCVSATKANAGKPSCSRLAVLGGSFGASAAAGGNSTLFSGRLSGRSLPAGRYLLVATETAAGATSDPASVGFSILAP